MRSLLVLALSLIASAAAAVEPLPVGPLPLVPAPYEQTPLDFAANGDSYLALWSDARSTLDLESAIVPAKALFDVSLDAVGTPATPVGRRLLSTAYNAKVAPRGSGYLLAYTDPAGSFTVPLDADGAEIATPKPLPGGPVALATNGSNFLLLQSQAVSILGADGSVIHSAAIAEFFDHSPIWTLTNGSYQFVVYRYYCNGVTACLANVVLTTVTSAGDVAETQLFELPQGAHVTAASGNGRVLVADTASARGQMFVEYRLFDTRGFPLHDAVQVDAQPSTCCPSYAPAVGWDGSEFLVAYPWPDLRAVRVTADGVLLGAAPFVLDPAGGTPPLFATNGATTVLVWGSGTYDTSDLVSRTVRSFDELAGTTTRVVAKSLGLERGVRVASGPAGVLAVWREGYPNAAILASIVGRAAFTLASAGSLDLQTPVVARGRDAFLVVWREQETDSYHLVARRVSFDGVPLDGAPFVVAAETGNSIIYGTHMPSIAVASDGTDWLVVYPSTNLGVRAVRVSAAGSVLDAAPIALSLPSPHFGIPAAPHVVWSGPRYVALWPEDLSNPFILVPQAPASALYEARITAAGQLVDTRMIWHGGYVPDAALAAAPSRLLAAWTDGVSLYAMPLDIDGTPLTDASVLAAQKPVWPPPIPDVDAAWDGATFVTAWTVRTGEYDARIEYEHLDANALPVESAPIELAPELGTKYTPSLTSTSNGVAIAFHAIADTYVARVFATALPRANLPTRRRVTR